MSDDMSADQMSTNYRPSGAAKLSPVPKPVTKSRSAAWTQPEHGTGRIKCLVWDLDNTLWDGILLENDQVELRPGIVAVIRRLDERGILHSIASRSDRELALAKIAELGLADYFLYPQINWNAKSASLEAIAAALSIGLDAVAFIDDQPFERDEVAHALPQVLCLDVDMALDLPGLPAFTPRFITADSRHRRQMYRNNIIRDEAEQQFSGAPVQFLAELKMLFSIGRVSEVDLHRAEELTLRTNQLNTTGYTYDYEQLSILRRSPDHLLLIAGLEDKYGPYGRIGLALVECQTNIWTIKLLLMSCRVISRGVGTVLLAHIMGLARQAGVRLLAEFVPNGRNRQMLVTYRFAGFQIAGKEGDRVTLEHTLSEIPQHPDYIQVKIE